MKPNLQQTADKATKMDNSACSLIVVIDLTITASTWLLLLSILQGHCSLLLAWNSVPNAYSIHIKLLVLHSEPKQTCAPPDWVLT